jgi:glutaredoxin
MRTLLIAAVAALVLTPAFALYKVVGPDGKVTYTDQPPASAGSSKVSAVRPGSGQDADAGLPFELRQPTQRYPVVLYTSADCVPCDSGRQLLLQRGIPYSEKRLASEDDARAYEQLGRGRTVPGLSIGSQQLRGLNTAEWQSYLDAAGYPKESRLPRNWKPSPVTALVEGRPAPAGDSTAAAREPAPALPVRRNVPAAPAAAPPSPTGIRF